MLRLAARKGRPPGGRRRTAAEVERLVDRAAELVAAGHSRGAIAAELRIPIRTVDEYVRRVRDRWAQDSKERAPGLRAEAIARIDRLARITEENAAWSARVALERLRVDLVGVRALPPQIGVESTGGLLNMDLAIELLGSEEEIENAVRDLLDGRVSERAKKLIEVHAMGQGIGGVR